ncbi:galectin-4-like isoform X2 [Tachysurus vachellii]|uniref:galectin-4-like isoform X2 n=1 Tax=Tachysurus vachellii TaxID=175792 RepID=UPI00296AD20C|nr:galectin-4-like isoform X2 [Tachysurus vachellii]
MAFVAPPGYQPLYNPTIPYVGPISGGLRAGMSIYIQGKIQHHINRFHVNLQCGEFDGCDIAFHFNPRFDLWDKVIFNTFQNGAWEGEEKVREMPFSKGEHFELVIVVNSEGYQVNVNGREFYLFQHRMPLDRVCAIEIGGDVSIDTINLIGGMQGMGGGNMGYPGGNLPVMGLQPIFNPDIPYSNMIPGGMVPKRTIIIRGMVPYQADRFWINFLVGGSRNIAFHLNPRIREGVVVRNCQIDGSWGNEEVDINFNPFQEGQYFEISIRCSEEKFKVYANGQHMCNFHHRLRPYNQIDMLEVGGDVQLSYIHY